MKKDIIFDLQNYLDTFKDFKIRLAIPVGISRGELKSSPFWFLLDILEMGFCQHCQLWVRHIVYMLV